MRRTATVFQKTLGLNDFYFGSDDFEFPLGNIQMVGKSSAEMFRGEKPGQTRLAPEWTLDRVARHAIDFWLSTEDLPSPENRVTLEPDGNVRLSYTETNAEARKRLYEKLKSLLPKLDMNAGPPDPPVRVHEERDPGGRRRPPGGHVPVRDGSGLVRAEHRLPGARGRQPLRRRHERLPVDRRRQPGADRDGELAPRRRPPAGADGREPARDDSLSRAGAIPPSGRQLELVHGDQRAVVVEVGGGLRTYTAGGRELLDGYGADEMCTSGRGQVLLPWPNRIEDGTYEFDGRRHTLALDEPERRNAIHGLVRWSAWTVAEHEPARVVVEHVLHPQPGYPFSLAVGIEYALSDAGLAVTTTATNVGPEPCPYGCGAHPYLTLGTPTVDPSS